MADGADTPDSQERDAKTGQFIKGKKGGPGRPRGSRAKLGEAFVADLMEDWEDHGKTVIEAVRKDRPQDYLKVVASILPKDVNVNVRPLEEMTDDQLRSEIARAARELGPAAALILGGAVEGAGKEKTRKSLN